MIYKIKYHPFIIDDLRALDKSIRDKVIKKIDKLRSNPRLGQPLGHKAGMDLSNHYKLYVDNRRICIITV